MKFSSTQYVNLGPNELIQHAIANREGVIASNQGLTVKTGKRTGRSPNDRFIVKDALVAPHVDWGSRNQPIDKSIFDQLWKKACDFVQDKPLYIGQYGVGAHPSHTIPVTVVTQYAWHQLFVQNLFIRKYEENKNLGWTMLNVPALHLEGKAEGVNTDAALIFDFTERKILLCGLEYAGEMKKAMFAVLNYLLPEHQVLPMHCAANANERGEVALFFGLSGTGKTTLSADPERFLIGDDEHGWSSEEVFNFEGGCYAKCIDLSQEKEPMIWNAIRHGAVLENVVLKENAEPDYKNASLTQNTRAAYPLEHIDKRVQKNYAGHPKVVIFLACDLYGVLPPVARLSKAQAAYYFLSGYTALVGSTEIEQSSPVKPVFSTCFGAPFFPRNPKVYAQLLLKRLEETGARVYLVNTGWSRGSYAEGGERFSIPTTRAVVRAILTGEIEKQSFDTLSGFNLKIPTALPLVDPILLNPRKAWTDPSKYDENAALLIKNFIENFAKFTVDNEICEAGPAIIY